MNIHFRDMSNITSIMATDYTYTGYTTTGWYFVDETGASVVGPYNSKKEASDAMKFHMVDLNIRKYE